MSNSISREEAIEEISRAVLKDRQNAYGPPENSFSIIADFWTTYLSRHKDGPLHPHDVAAMMMLLKVARSIINPQHPDNWIDGGGYAVCGVELATLQQFIGGLANPVMEDNVGGGTEEDKFISDVESRTAYKLACTLDGITLKPHQPANLELIRKAHGRPHMLSRKEFNQLCDIILGI